MIRLLIALLLLSLALPVWAANVPMSAPCQNISINLQGSGNADITVDATAGGVTVMAANNHRCAVLITNSSANDMRCAPTNITVTSSVGYYVKGNTTLELGPGESKDAWKCIRTGGSSATASVLESVP